MRFLLAGIMTHPNRKKSTGRFGALQVRKVLSSVLTNCEKNLERTLEKSNTDAIEGQSRTLSLQSPVEAC
jgi:hypothetical protein